MRQSDRKIDWRRDSTKAIATKISTADGAPGVLDTLLGRACYLYGAHVEDRLAGPAGKIIAQRDGAICIGTIDGAVWVSHLRAKDQGAPQEQECRVVHADVGCGQCDPTPCSAAGIKLPATQVLGSLLHGVPEAPLPIDTPTDHRTFREIVYEEDGDVGYLSFDFYNGAMSTAQCYRLRDGFLYARSRPTKVIVLLGGADFWSNGIHLNIIEASDDPAEESWRNINAIDDLIVEILNTMSHLVIAGLRGNAGAGGAMLALAADYVYSACGVVLNPHYRGMGKLYGSEYWTYLLPKRVGQARALELTQACQPIGARAARNIGFIDEVFGEDARSFEAETRDRAKLLSESPEFRALLRRKHERRIEDESVKPLASYRAEELERMKINFFGTDPSYHEARRRFVFKGNPPPKAAPVPIRATTKEWVSIPFVALGAAACPTETGRSGLLVAHG
jgi:putative two-component system hydrogenase maturation factor HypX/HoxX